MIRAKYTEHPVKTASATLILHFDDAGDVGFIRGISSMAKVVGDAVYGPGCGHAVHAEQLLRALCAAIDHARAQ